MVQQLDRLSDSLPQFCGGVVLNVECSDRGSVTSPLRRASLQNQCHQVERRTAVGGKVLLSLLKGAPQSLDRLLPVRGFGFTASLMKVRQTSGDPSVVALGVPKDAYNLTAYYENRGLMLRISQAFSKGSQTSTLNQNGIGQAALFSDDYKQVDLSASLALDSFFDLKGEPMLTVNVNNLTNSKQRSYFQFPNATFTQYEPARSYFIGLRMKFR